MLEGELRFMLDGELSSAPAGSFVYVPRGTEHAFQNAGDVPARILVIFNPSGMERFFDRIAELGTDGLPDPGAFKEIGSGVGMQVVGPPLARPAEPAA